MADSTTYQNQQTTSIGAVSDNIFAQIRKEQWDFMFNWIQIVPGYPFNQYWNIKRCHLYLNSKFEDSSQYNNRDKLFFNIVLPPCEVAMRMLNLDTKDIRLWPLEPKSYFKTHPYVPDRIRVVKQELGKNSLQQPYTISAAEKTDLTSNSTVQQLANPF